ncbi:sugar ABC transporter permease [Actinobaculum sp. 313]|uniref:carbohydrate ABC transporter permease n=1 Tax=Actinobaculum sp. 313 TaxID=2495645 RepID=UPI000D5274AA|nr:sugar ABC transporter permease [Actinobaculum sp. 313]AWE42195.1 ABC transporter permease [Actinobaculum sp. 313]
MSVKAHTTTQERVGQLRGRKPRKVDDPRLLLAILLGPALLILVVMVVYPIIYSVWRSLFDDAGTFVGLENYATMFRRSSTFTAVRNNLIWVVVAPIICTVLGLIFAVLMDKVRWKTAFKLVIFMPMAISMLASGVVWRAAFSPDPNKGLVNAILVHAKNVFDDSTTYPNARPRDDQSISRTSSGDVTTDGHYRAGDVALFPLVGINQDSVADAEEAVAAQANDNAIIGTVWLDFVKGGGGEIGQIDGGKRGLRGIQVEAIAADGSVAATATTEEDGTFILDVPGGQEFTVSLPAVNFSAAPSGVNWLGPSLITPVIILAFIWIWAGFSMVMIASGLSAVDRSLMEAARTDGANEWQVFRHITVPQLMPVLSVVLVTLMINVLKIFDLVYVISPGESKPASNVVAVQMWTEYGARNFGMGSTLAVFLLLMVLPFMIINIRNFRRGGLS